jgi:putative addiction module component (TIGR02574 family)
MPTSLSELDLTQLTVDQRLELIGLLWDSIPESAEALPIPEWHRQELERRLAAAEAAPELAIPWEQVRSRLRAIAVARLPNPMPRTGAELVAYWEREGLLGTRPDITDPSGHARTLRENAEKREQS